MRYSIVLLNTYPMFPQPRRPVGYHEKYLKVRCRRCVPIAITIATLKFYCRSGWRDGNSVYHWRILSWADSNTALQFKGPGVSLPGGSRLDIIRSPRLNGVADGSAASCGAFFTCGSSLPISWLFNTPYEGLPVLIYFPLSARDACEVLKCVLKRQGTLHTVDVTSSLPNEVEGVRELAFAAVPLLNDGQLTMDDGL
ncbi:hypothetical protein G7K_2278-t1 [Saitoella complicata NRRL Y-17804]|uniref:Uncharacterized protein n=1 Tax=Saitoella complicata (strain BCRC 22490 / CBS 7301 / JCM 7358 / NBRC 10748 / NRRL Y-17804) TaxID=698492 RepID=A0A0E9NEG9_SAICN|nr:hypothetical protein G7K_2278-t1 [Saitoella complicata NRRL Y-17804]